MALAHVRHAMIRPRYDRHASDECSPPGNIVRLLLLLQRVKACGRRSRAFAAFMPSCCCSLKPFGRVAGFKFDVEAQSVSGHQLANLKRLFFERQPFFRLPNRFVHALVWSQASCDPVKSKRATNVSVS
jgi:hypothetical protein